jgi:hypothetical protein
MHNCEGRVDRDYPTGHLSTVAKCCRNVECRFYHVKKRNIPHRRWMFFLRKRKNICVSFHWKGRRFKSTLLLRRYNGYSRLHECTSYVVGYCWMLSILYYWFAWQVTGQVIHSFFSTAIYLTFFFLCDTLRPKRVRRRHMHQSSYIYVSVTGRRRWHNKGIIRWCASIKKGQSIN